MEKLHVFLSVLFQICFLKFVAGQGCVRVNYELEVLPSSDNNLLPAELTSGVSGDVLSKIEMDEQMTREFYSLEVAGRRSKFSLDSIGYVQGYEPYSRSIVAIRHQYFKDLSSGEVFIYCPDVIPNQIGQLEILPFVGFEIQNESKEILGFNCQKAIWESESSGTVELWFTIDLPISDGPRKWAGLPGLILEVQTDSQIIRGTRIENNCDVEEVLIPDILQIPYKQYIEKFRKTIK